MTRLLTAATEPSARSALTRRLRLSLRLRPPMVATLDQDYTVPAAVHLAAPLAIQVAILPAPSPTIRVGHVEFVEHLIHGPPRAPTLQRGPPSSHLL